MAKSCGCDGTLHDAFMQALDPLGERNRSWFHSQRVTMVHLIGAPGAGKTTLLEATIQDLGAHVQLAALQADPETSSSAERIHRLGCPVLQVNTVTACRLEASSVEEGVKLLRPAPGSMLFVENVGNLLCPAFSDLGERVRVVVMSVTEGEDAPLKYPSALRAAQLLVLSKADLAAHLRFDTERFVANAKVVNSGLDVLSLSARDRTGVEQWCQWLESWLDENADSAPRSCLRPVPWTT